MFHHAHHYCNWSIGMGMHYTVPSIYIESDEIASLSTIRMYSHPNTDIYHTRVTYSNSHKQ